MSLFFMLSGQTLVSEQFPEKYYIQTNIPFEKDFSKLKRLYFTDLRDFIV